MESVAKKDTKSAAQARLKKAVDWKIFEIQSVLVSEDVGAADVEESLLWLQPKHYADIIEERVNDERCGFPLCANPLHGSNASYRVDYKEKKIYSIELSNNYCCGECIEKGLMLEKKYDSSVPYSRSVVKSLDLAAPSNAVIDDILNLLGPHSSATAKAGTKNTANVDERDLPPLPVYTNTALAESGELQVQFVNGFPVKTDTADRTSGLEETAQSKFAQQSTSGDRLSDMDVVQADDADESAVVTQDTMHVDALVPAINREVYVTVPSPLPYQQLYEERGLLEKGPKEVTAAASPTLKKASILHSRMGTTTSGTTTASRSAGSEAVSMAEMFATMNALRVKHNLDNPSTSPSPKKANKFVDGSLLAERDGSEVPPAKEHKVVQEVSETAVRSGTIGRRPGPKSVSWGQNQATSVTEPTAANDAVPVGTAAPGVTDERPALKGAALTITEKPAKQPEPMKLGGKRSAMAMQMGGQVLERTNPTVLSAGAILRKREPADAAMEVVYGPPTDGGNGTEDGEHWVDVDPSELDASNAASALSIEGYIASVKRAMRVSPATTIKNLSHSPYTYSQAAENDDGPDVEVTSDAGDGDADGEADVDSYSEGDPAEGKWEAQEGGDGDGEGEMTDDAWSDEDNGGDPASADPLPGKSMFLALWSTMDELFGGSLESVFSSERPQPALRTPQSAVVFEENPPQEYTTSRIPLALEQQNAQQAFVKLLQRGLQAAESRLDLYKLYLNLPQERALYQTIKHRLIAVAAASLQTRNNLQQSAGSSAGGGLQSDAWTLIGLLIIDAVVVKKQLGPLRRPKDSATAAAVDTASSNSVQRDVSLDGWSRVVETQAAQVLSAVASRPAASSLGKLREGDLNILRSYFDYV